MKKYVKVISAIFAAVLILTVCALPAFAAEENTITEDAVVLAAAEEAPEAAENAESNTVNVKAIAAAALIAIAASAGAIGMAVAIKSGSVGISRQPEAAGNIRTNVMLGLVFIETAIIYALIVAILIIFVL